MFGIGFSEMLLIGVILLIAVGPRRLPQMMKTVGRGLREIRRASNELRRSVGFDEMMRDADVRSALHELPPPPVSRAPHPRVGQEKAPEEPHPDLHDRVVAERPPPGAPPEAFVPPPAADSQQTVAPPQGEPPPGPSGPVTRGGAGEEA